VPVQDASEGSTAGIGVGDRWPVANLESHDGGWIDFAAAHPDEALAAARELGG
jgi:hypothetical protein